MILVHCLSCHRKESWQGDERLVLLPGGQRQPSVHAELAKWRTLRASRKGTIGPVAGVCSGCEQPLIAEDRSVDLTPHDWVLHTPGGDLTVAEDLIGPDGPMSDADADFWIEEILREKLEIKPATWLFQGFLLTSMMVPVLLWLWAGVCFGNIVLHVGRGP